MYKRLQDFILKLPVLAQILQWSKVTSFPGFFDVPIYDVIVFIFNEIKREALVTRANSMAFSFFLSLFPFIIALITLLPYLQKYIIHYLPFENKIFYETTDVATLLETLKENFQEFIPEGIFNTISDVAMNPRPGLLSIGFILAIFFGSNGMMALMRGFEKSYKSTFRKRSVIRKRMVAIFLTFLIAVMLIVSVILVILGQRLMTLLFTYIDAGSFGAASLQIIRWLVVLALFYTGIAVIYRYGSATIRRFRWFSPGTTLATVLSILSSLVFSFYVKEFDTYNQLYGYIGTIIVIMLWIQINAFNLLIGFELNASIAVNRDLKLEKSERDEDD